MARLGRVARAKRKRSVELRQHGLDGMALLANRDGFADAQDDAEAGGQGGLRLGFHLGIAFAAGVPSLAVAGDGQDGPRIDQHLRRNGAGVRAFFGAMDILAADRKVGNRAHRPLDQGRRQAQRDVDLWIFARSLGDGANSAKSTDRPCIFQFPATSFFNAIQAPCIARP